MTSKIIDSKTDAAREPTGGPLKDSTTTLPMVDLEEAVKVVAAIYEKALETASMPEVAKALGYANATSTPFYRRITAARLFGLLSAKSALTERAMNYIKPHDEGMKANVLADAVLGISSYAELIKTHYAKKLNIGLLANKLAKDFNLTDSCAGSCARAFEASLRFSGMLSDDGSVMSARTQFPIKDSVDLPPQLPQPEPAKSTDSFQDKADAQQQTLYLGKSKERRFTISGPVEITQAEYERICKWLSVVMVVEDHKED